MLKTSLRRLLVLGLVLLLGACGFHLRGSANLPFKTLYLSLNDTSEMYALLARTVKASSQTDIVKSAKEAEAVLSVTGDMQRKTILSLNTSGRVREYQLIRTFSFRVADPEGRDLLPPATIELRRDITYSDDQVLSKEAEEVLLWRDIQNDLVQQILRRLSAAQTKPIADATDASGAK
ncbi:MAG TPA: LPS assembly lipoprotein LptE [Rhodocyclaceae bacterium]|nr:LPS assembly lipoprotein LptE [Rhodocyclaceae bacterium]